MSLVLDSSAALAWIYADETEELHLAGRTLGVPTLGGVQREGDAP